MKLRAKVEDPIAQVKRSLNYKAIPFVDDAEMHINARSGTSLTDVIGSQDATILHPCYLKDPAGSSQIIGDSSRDAEKVFDGDDHTLYFKMKFVKDVPGSSAQDQAGFGGGRTATRRGIEFRTYSNNLWIMISDGTTGYSSNILSDVNTNLKDIVVDVHVTWNEYSLDCNIYNSAGTVLATYTRDITAFVFNSNSNYSGWIFRSEYALIDNIKKFDDLKTLAECQTDTHTSDLQIHIPNLFAAADISGNAIDLSHSDVDESDMYYDNVSDWLVSYGYDCYEVGLDAAFMRTIARTAAGVTTTPSRDGGAFWVASRIVWESDSTVKLNLRDSGILFTNDFFDRSDTDIWGASARAGYYDSDRPKYFHISELNQRTLYGWLNVGYKGRLAVRFETNSIEKWDRDNLLEIILYSNDKTLTDNKAVLTYTGDIFAAVLDNDDAVTYDTDNYVKIGTLKSVSPMLTIRFDDGFIDQFTDYKTFFDGYDIPAVVGIHSAEVGTGNYATWDTLIAAYNEGYEICCHNNEDNDYNTVAMVDVMEQDQLDGVEDQENRGMECNYHIGNRHSSANPSLAYFTHKSGLDAHLASNSYGKDSIHGANPREVDVYRLCAMAIDINSPDPNPYYLSTLPNSTEIQAIKDHMDTVISESRWLIMFVHTYNVNVANGLAEVLTHWLTTNSQEHYTMKEALANLKYL